MGARQASVACRIACLVALGFEPCCSPSSGCAAAAGDHAGALAQVACRSGRRRRRRAVVDRRRHLAVDSRLRHQGPSRGSTASACCWSRSPSFLGIVAVGASWTEIAERTGFFHFYLMWTLAGVIGVFLALDLFLFFFFWELMLVPMYFLIGIWGHEKRDLRRAQVLPVHAGERAADAARDHRRRLRRQERDRRLELRLRRAAGGADRSARSPPG